MWATIILGFLTFSGSLINLIKGKNYILIANNEGLIIFTKDINNNLPKIFINWSDVQTITTETIKSFFRDTQGGHRSVLKIKIKPNLIQWPPIMITKNKIGFKKYNDYDEISIDAWLNKNKNKIVDELNKLK